MSAQVTNGLYLAKPGVLCRVLRTFDQFAQLVPTDLNYEQLLAKRLKRARLKRRAFANEDPEPRFQRRHKLFAKLRYDGVAMTPGGFPFAKYGHPRDIPRDVHECLVKRRRSSS